MKNARAKIREVAENFDFPEFQNTAYTLWEIEKGSSYEDFERSSRYCYDKLAAAGFSDVRRYAHKADGVSGTAFADGLHEKLFLPVAMAVGIVVILLLFLQ